MKAAQQNHVYNSKKMEKNFKLLKHIFILQLNN